MIVRLYCVNNAKYLEYDSMQYYIYTMLTTLYTTFYLLIKFLQHMLHKRRKEIERNLERDISIVLLYFHMAYKKLIEQMTMNQDLTSQR